MCTHTLSHTQCGTGHSTNDSHWISVCSCWSLWIHFSGFFHNEKNYLSWWEKREKGQSNGELPAYTSLEDSSIWSFISLIFCSSSSRLFRITIRASSIAANSWVLCSSPISSGVCGQEKQTWVIHTSVLEFSYLTEKAATRINLSMLLHVECLGGQAWATWTLSLSNEIYRLKSIFKSTWGSFIDPRCIFSQRLHCSTQLYTQTRANKPTSIHKCIPFYCSKD